jgi:hypothetical protein
MLHPFHGKRDTYPLQLEALAFYETLVLVSQITWGHVRGFFLFVLRPVLIVAKIVCLCHRVRLSVHVYQLGYHWTDICEICYWGR